MGCTKDNKSWSRVKEHVGKGEVEGVASQIAEES